MKEIKIKSITLTNFRGHKETKATFSNVTTISGDNGTGKSTVFEAFLWLLFGKDQFDRKDYEIIPTVNGKIIERIDSNVTATILVDGREIELSRTLHQKWVRPRGQAEEKFDGCETLYTFDGVDIKAGEYKARVDLIVQETVFKLITNSSAFLSMHWTKLREFLFQMAGSLNDGEILDRMATLTNKDAIANLTNILNQGKKLSEFKKEIAALKKKAKTELEDIQPRIDQTTRLMPANRDFSAIEKEIESIDNEIIVIDGQLQDRSKAIRGQFEAIQEKQKQINDLKTKQRIVENTEFVDRQNIAFNANQQCNELQNEFNTVKVNLKAAESDMETASNGIATLRKRKKGLEQMLVEIRERWETENAKEYKAKEGCLMCPVFGHECSDSTASSKHAEVQGNAKAAFIKEQNAKLDKLEEEGINCAEEIKKLEVRINDGQLMHDAAKKKAEELNTKYNEIGHRLGEMQVATPAPVIAEELPEWQELEKQIKAIEATINDVQPVDNTDLNTKKAELNTKRDGLKKDLSDRDIITRHKSTITELEARGKELAQQIADLEGQEFTIDAFNRVKIEECDRRINGMFNSVRFQLFDKTIDGNEFECCNPTNLEGVRYDVTNTAEQVNMGLECVNVLSRFYNVSAPVFIDRCESVNVPINAGSQMILIKVTAPGTPFQVK